MVYHAWDDIYAEKFYLAGERVPSGLYQEIETGRKICLDHEDFLPASFDGRVATYRSLRHLWQAHQTREESRELTPQ